MALNHEQCAGQPEVARAQRMVEQLAPKGVEALWAKGKGGGFWIRNYHYVSLSEAEDFLETGR